MALRSVYSDPVGAGLESAQRFLNILDTLEDHPVKRKLRQLTLARAEREEELAPAEQELKKKQIADASQQLDQKAKWAAIAPHLEVVHQAYQKAQAAQAKGEIYAMSDKELDSLFEVHKASHSTPKTQEDFQTYTRAHRNLTAFYIKHKDSLEKANGVIERGKYGPEVDKAMDDLAKVMPYIQSDFKDRYGKGDKDGRVVTINKIFIRDGKMSFGLHIESPVGDDIFPHISDGQVYQYPHDDTINQVEQGNINLNDPNRKIHGNANGSISSIRTITIKQDGTTILLPTVAPDGKFMTNEEAVKRYEKTGEHLGKFPTEADAKAYDEILNRDLNTGIGKADLERYTQNIQDKGEGKKVRAYDAPLGLNADPNTIAQIPLNFITASHDQHGRVIDMVLRAEAQNPRYWDELHARREKKEERRTESAAVTSAFKELQKTAGWDGMTTDQRRAALAEKLGESGDLSVKEIADLTKTMIPEKQPKSEIQYKTEKGVDLESRDGGVTWGPRFSPRQRQPKDTSAEDKKEKREAKKDKKEAAKSIEQSAHDEYVKALVDPNDIDSEGVMKNVKNFHAMRARLNPKQRALIDKLVKRAKEIQEKKDIDPDEAWEEAKKEHTGSK